MKLNNKGMTLIEIIVSIVLISIVLVFLAILLVDVKDINDESKTNSTYLVNKALIIKNIEEDLLKYVKKNNGIKISSCEIGVDIYNNNYNEDDLNETNQKFNECLQIKYTDDDSAYIGIFYSNSTDTKSYVVFYSHGTTQRKAFQLNDYARYNLLINKSGNVELKNEELKINIKLADGTSCTYYDFSDCTSSTNGATLISIPIIGNDGKDYTIEIPYYGKVTIE